jgi:hypothetical protein
MMINPGSGQARILIQVKQTHMCTRDWFYEEFASNWAITWWWLVGSWLGRQSVQNNGEEDQAALTTMFIFCRGNLWLKLWWNCDNKPRRILDLFTENGSFHSVTYAKTNIGIANPHGSATTQLEPLDLRSTQLLKFQYMPFLDSRRQETAKTSRNAAMNKQWMAKLMRVLLGRDPNHKFMDKFYLYQSMQWQSNTDPASSPEGLNSANCACDQAASAVSMRYATSDFEVWRNSANNFSTFNFQILLIFNLVIPMINTSRGWFTTGFTTLSNIQR